MPLPEFSKMTQDKTAIPEWAKDMKQGEFISYSPTFKSKIYFDLFDKYLYPCAKTGDITYYLYDPTKHGWDKNKKYPLLMWLHGANNGLDGVKCIMCCGAEQYASPKYQQEMGGAYILVPLANEKRLEDGRIQGTWSEESIPYYLPVKEIFDKVVRENKDSIKGKFVFGASSGGRFVWQLLEKYPDYFDAAVPIAAAYVPSKELLKNVAGTKTKLLVAHGQHDEMAEYNKCIEPFLPDLKAMKNCTLFLPRWVYNGDGGIASIFYGFEMGQHCMINWIQANLIFDSGKPADIDLPKGITGWIKEICESLQ